MTPFVKWAGGKRQLINDIKNLMPKSYNNYYEPFIGGGALFFEIKPDSAIISDMNKELIITYQVIRDLDSFKKLIKNLDEYENNHNEDFYYKIRDLDRENNFINKDRIEIAARFMYLNKACFNGLYRVNSKGYFNVPFGKKDKINTYNLANMLEIHDFLSNKKIEIHYQDFDKTVETASKGDFVYFDPPYDVIDKKQSFIGYNKNVFDRNAQIRLAETFKRLNDRGVFIMLSNHNTEFIQELYKDFNIHIVKATRMINSNSLGRGKIEEVIITNYE